MKECLFNTNSNNVAAYCRYHKCYMTVRQMRCKECLKKYKYPPEYTKEAVDDVIKQAEYIMNE